MKRLTLFFALFLFTAGWSLAQQTIMGRVTEKDGEPLPGVTVSVKGAPGGAAADENGAYSIKMPPGADVLVFSLVGYEALEEKIAGRTVVDVQLTEASGTLNEVIVVGYGKQIKSKLTGNIAKVDGKDIANTPVTSIEQALKGKAAGVFIENGGGKLGALAKIQVRGPSSIGAASRPLVVVDGVPLQNEAFSPVAPGGGSSLNTLSFLNFNDVESIEILKDASAGAIYGSRAANGVILVTTKTGKKGQARVDFNYLRGFSKPTRLRKYLNAEQYVQFLHQSAEGGGKYDYKLNPGWWASEQAAIDFYTYFVDSKLDAMAGHTDWRKGEVNTDWQSLVFQDAPMDQADLSFSGGNEGIRYYASLGYSNQTGIVIGNEYQKYNGRLNLDGSLRKNLDFGMNFSFARDNNRQIPQDGFFHGPMGMGSFAPISPVRDPNGNLYNQPVTLWYNPLLELEGTKNVVRSNNTLGNLFLNWRFLPGFSLRGDFGANLQNHKSNLFYSSKTAWGAVTNGLAAVNQGVFSNYYWKTLLNYDKTFGDAHSVGFTGGYEYQQTRTEASGVEGVQFPVDDLSTIGSAASTRNAFDIPSESKFISWFGRLNYDFDAKYLLTLSARADGSSRFGKNNRWGFFPAASLGWVMSNEPFMKDSKVLSFLKPRVSYGLTGNAFIGDYRHQGLYNAVRYAGQPGIAPVQIENPDLRWERTAQLDAGIDFGFFQNRLSGEVDVYFKKTNDLLLDVPVPTTSGFSTQLQNVGAVENKGVELVLNSNNLTGDFKWTTQFNLAYNHNEVVQLNQGQELIDYGFTGVGIKVGSPVNSFLLTEYAGVDPANGDALFYLNTPEAAPGATTNNFSLAAKLPMGDPNPDFIGGLTNTFSWKGLTLGLHLQWVLGRQAYNHFDQYYSCSACWFDNQTEDQLTAWKKPGDITNVPEARWWWGNGNQGYTTRYMYDASYLRVKTISLAYDFPSKLLRSWRLRNLTIYTQAINWFTFTDYKGWDPETNNDRFLATGDGVDYQSPPQAKTWSFGVKVGL